MAITRRGLWSLVPAMWLARFARAARPQTDQALPSRGFPYDQLTVRKNANGSQTIRVLSGKTATGEAIEVHETVLPVGGAPHPPHHHRHSEMWLIRDGTVELMIKGKSQKLGPGSAAFVASNEEHGIRNVGDRPASYFVVAVGPGADGAH